MTPEELLVAALKQSQKIVFGKTIGTDTNGNCTVQGEDGSVLARSGGRISAGDCVALKADDGQWYAVSARRSGSVQKTNLFKRRNVFIVEEEEEEIIIPTPLVSYDILSFLIFSGNGVSGNPRSEVSVSTVSSSLPPSSQQGVVYTMSYDTGQLESQSGALPLQLSGASENNTINVAESTAIQEFIYDATDPENIIQSNQIGVTLSGSYVNHPDLIPPSSSTSFWQFGIKLNLASQGFVKEWDVIGDPDSEEAIRPIGVLDAEIARLDEALDEGKRAVVLTKLIATKGLDGIKNTTIVTITNQRIILGNPFFAQGLEFVLEKIFDDKLPEESEILPLISPEEEFVNLSANLDILITRLNSFNANPNNITVFNAERSARDCTKEGERVVKLQAFIDANGFTNYITGVNSRPFIGLYEYNYQRVNWFTIASSPLDLSFEIEGVPYEFDFGVYLIRQGDFYYVGTDGDMSGIPFGRSQYNARIKWRKRGNTEWFSI